MEGDSIMRVHLYGLAVAAGLALTAAAIGQSDGVTNPFSDPTATAVPIGDPIPLKGPALQTGSDPVVKNTPEPATLVMTVIGAGAAGLYRWRRRVRTAPAPVSSLR
jgi:hypothetical protein